MEAQKPHTTQTEKRRFVAKNYTANVNIDIRPEIGPEKDRGTTMRRSTECCEPGAQIAWVKPPSLSNALESRGRKREWSRGSRIQSVS